MSEVTARQLNRATLARQMLLKRERIDVAAGVRRVTALQAQEPASPYLALWNRVDGFDPADLDRAYAEQEVVKASLMRITLHAVHVDDYSPFHTAMQPTLRAARLNDRRYRDAGLLPGDADEFLPTVFKHGVEPRPSAEFEALHDEPRMWWALRHYGPFWHAPTGGPWSFGARNAFVGASTWPHDVDLDEGARYLIRRCLEGFGPASVADISHYVLFPNSKTRTRELVASMGEFLVRLEGPGGVELFDVPEGVVPDEDVPAPPRLLPMWDSVLLAYADRSRIISDEYRPHVIRRNGDTLASVLVDGYVVGVWRVIDGGVEVTTFERLSDEAWDGLEAEARALADFLNDRDPMVFARHTHWWKKGIPAAEVRRLS